VVGCRQLLLIGSTPQRPEDALYGHSSGAFDDGEGPRGEGDVLLGGGEPGEEEEEEEVELLRGATDRADAEAEAGAEDDVETEEEDEELEEQDDDRGGKRKHYKHAKKPHVSWRSALKKADGGTRRVRIETRIKRRSGGTLTGCHHMGCD
jgi:hypothetical protein